MTEHQTYHIDTVDTKENTTIQERHPDWPELDVSFYFSPHAHAENLKKAPIAEADIYLYENVGVTQTEREDLQMTSDGHFNSLERKLERSPLKDSFFGQQLRGIHDSGVAIGSLDIPGDEDGYSSLAEGLMKADSSAPLKDTFISSLEAFDENMAALAKMQNTRERIMAERFDNEIAQILAKRPQLKDKPRLKVLITMGSYHTKLRHALTERGIPSNREFSTPVPWVYSYTTELERAHAYHKEPSLDLLEKAWAQDFITHAITGQIGVASRETYSSSVEQYVRDIVSHLNHEQCQQIYELVRNSPDASIEIHDINQILKAGGIGEIPNNPEAIREQLDVIEHLSLTGLAGHVRRFRSVSP